MTDMRNCQPLNAKAHLDGRALNARDGQLACFGRRSHAARAHFNFFRPIALHNRHGLEVRVEATAGVPLTETDSISKRRTFSTFSTFCHIEEPPDFCTQSVWDYSISGHVWQPETRQIKAGEQ
jgi:hypothetical protein